MQTKTTIINLFAGPGVGKSTLASDLFFRMKKDGLEVEMAREWIKLWAWEGKKPTFYDQFMIFGNQVHEETTLYGKVDFVITDCPLLLIPFYEKMYFGSSHTLQGAKAVVNKEARHINFLIERTRPYNGNGRYQTEEQARSLDKKLSAYIKKEKIDVQKVKSASDIYKVI